MHERRDAVDFARSPKARNSGEIHYQEIAKTRDAPSMTAPLFLFRPGSFFAVDSSFSAWPDPPQRRSGEDSPAS